MSNPTADAQNGKQVSPPPYTPVDGCQAELDECRAAFEEKFDDEDFRLDSFGAYRDDDVSAMFIGWQAAWQARATAKGQTIHTPEPCGEGWKVIADAPLDGTIIDLWVKKSWGEERVCDAAYDKRFRSWMYGHNEPFEDNEVPTHWRLPPPPPADEATQ